VAGDFNCDPGCPEVFPEAQKGFELLASVSLHDLVPDSGPTESTHLNAFRAYLKPGQNREFRYDMILCSSLVVKESRSVEIRQIQIEAKEVLGNKQVGEGVSNGVVIPLFPSDHFGCFVKVKV